MGFLLVDICMQTQLLYGTNYAERLKQGLAKVVEYLRNCGINPVLAVCVIGDDPASKIYVRVKQKACSEVGITCRIMNWPADAYVGQLIPSITHLRSDEFVHGIIVQLPLPDNINQSLVLDAVPSEKDVDCFCFENVGRLVHNNPRFLPCTPIAVISYLTSCGIELAGKYVAVINSSLVVGRPLIPLLLASGATPVICHVGTRDIKAITSQADIVITAVGRRSEFVFDASYIKDNAVVVDVGITRQDDNTIVGDVDVASVSGKASIVSPVPGGIGPITVAILLFNTIKATIELTRNKIGEYAYHEVVRKLQAVADQATRGVVEPETTATVSTPTVSANSDSGTGT